MKSKIISLLLVITIVLPMCCINVYAAAPGTSIVSATNITETSATIRGKVTSNSGIVIKEYGFGWMESGGSSYTWKHFYKGTDFEYPVPENNVVLSHNISGLKSGTKYDYVFYAKNVNNEEGKSYGSFTTDEEYVDETEPDVTKVTSSVSSAYTGDSITFTATAYDTSYVVFYADSYKLGIAKVSSNKATYTHSDGFNTAGTRTIYAYPSNSSGTKLNSNYASTTVIIKSKGQVSKPTITYPTANSSISAESDLKITWNRPTTPSSGTIKYNVYLYESSDLVAEKIETTSTSFTVSSSYLYEGDYTIIIRALSSGYTASDDVSVEFSVTEAEVSKLTASSTSIYTGSSITFNATAIGASYVVFYADTTKLGVAKVNSGTASYTRSEGFNTAGTRTIYAYPANSSGTKLNDNYSNITISVKSKGQVSVPAITYPTSGGTHSSGEDLVITWNRPATPSSGTVKYNIYVYNKNDLNNSIAECIETTNTTYIVDGDLLSVGAYRIIIRALSAGYTASNDVILDFSTAANEPIVSSITPSVTEIYTGYSISFTATAKNTTKVVFYADGTYLGSATGSGISFKYTRTEGFNTAGTRTIYAYPCDSSGNRITTNYSKVIITVKSKGTLSNVQNISLTSGTTVTAGEDLKITWGAPQTPAAGDFKYNVVVTNSNDEEVFKKVETSYNYVTIPAENLTIGTYSLAVYAICQGYAASPGLFVQFSVQAAPSTQSITKLVASYSTIGTGHSITFSATTANTSYVAFYSDKVLLGVKNGSGTVSYTLTEGFNTSGTKTITAYPSDKNGNKQGSSSASVTVNVTASYGQIPAFSITAPSNGKTITAGENLTITWNKPSKPSSGIYYNLYLYDANDTNNAIYEKIKFTQTSCTIGGSYLTSGNYIVSLRAYAADYNVSNTMTSSFIAKDADEVAVINSVSVKNTTIQEGESLEFTVVTSINADNVAIVYDDASEPLYATNYNATTTSGTTKTWTFLLPMHTPAPSRVLKIYAVSNGVLSSNYKVITATVIGNANIEGDYIEYTPTSPKVGDTITFTVYANQYTDKISLDIGGTEYSTSTSYTDSGYLRKFTISYAFQASGTKTVNFYAWKNGTKNTESLKSENVYVAENNKKLANVTIESPYTGYSHVQGKILNVSWKNNASVTPDAYSVFLNGTALGVTSDTTFAIDSSLLTTIGEYNIDIYATKEGYTPSDGTRVTINVIASSISSTFNTDAVTLAKGDTFAFSGKVSSKTLLEKVTITILNVDSNTGVTFAEEDRIRKNSFDLSTLGSFVIGETYMKEPGNYQIRVFAKEYNNDGIEIANKPVVVSASNALITKFESSTYNTYTGIDIKFTVNASNTKKIIFEVDGYNIGTSTGTGTFTLNYIGFNTPGTRTVWAYPCDSNGDAVRTNGKSVTIEVDSYGTVGKAKITYPTSAHQVNTYEDLTIKWTGANSNCKYNVTVYDPNDDKIATMTETTANELTIDGDEIKTVGTYTVSIYTICDYYSPSYASATFYVTAENAKIEGFDNTPATRKIGDTIELEGTVKVDKGYLETITVNVWGPNSTSVGGKHKSVTLSGNVKTYDISNIADIIVGQDPMDKIGKYWVNVYVRTKGDNEAERVATKQVTVVAENTITLNAPVITSSLDAVEGADYTLTWTDVDNANLYEIKIPDLGFRESVEKDIEYVKIPKKYLNSTGTYDIEIRAINTKDSSYQDGITSKELVVKETADVMRIIRIEYPETNTVPEGTNLKVRVITDDGRARLSRIGVRHINNDLSYTWVSTHHAKAYSGDDIENALEWNIEIPVNLLENNRTLTLVLYDFLLIEKDTHDITFNCVENHNTMGDMNFTYWQNEWQDETERPVWWNAPQGLSSAVDYYLADLTHNGETKRIYQNGTDIISGTEPSLTIPADMLSDLGEYTLTITAYKEGYKKQSVSASFTVKCSHHDKYVKEDETLNKYSGKIKVDSTYHKTIITHNGRCSKCSQIVEVKKEDIAEKHFGKGTKYGEDGCKCCSCGWDDHGNYQAWFGYVQNGKDYDVYDVAGKRIGQVFATDAVFVSGKYDNTYLVTYNTNNGSSKTGFVPVEAIKDSEWVPSDKIKINGKLISIDKDASTNKIYAPIEDIIKCLNSGVSMNIHNNKNISVYIENNMYGCSYNIFADLSSCSNGEGRTLEVKQSADENDIHYIWAYIKNDKLYIDVVKFLVDFGGYTFDNRSSEYRRGYAVDVDNDLLRIAESLMFSSETNYWSGRIHDDGLDWMQYAYDVFKFDLVGGAMDAFDERKVQPDKKLKEAIMASITEKALDNSYTNTATTISGIIETLSPYVDTDLEIMTAYAQAFDSDNADALKIYLEPLSDNLELFGLYCSVNEIISLGAESATSLILLTMQYDESIRILDDMIKITPSDKMRKLYVSLKKDVYDQSLSSINKAIAGELALEVFKYAVENLDKFNKNIKSFKDFMMSSATKWNIVHIAASVICDNLLKGKSFYDSVAQVQICETNRQFLIADARAAYNAYSNRPDESNKDLLKTSLLALATVTIDELEHIIDWQNSYLFGTSAYLLEDIEDEKKRIINLKEQLS